MTSSQPQGYLALPPSGAGPGVLVLHAWWGLSGAIQQVCDRLAAEGFIAYAPDLFNGRHAATIAEADALSSQADPTAVKAAIAAAVDHLWGRLPPGADGVAVVGFSFGAYFALQLSASDPQRVRLVVLFYGTGDADFTQAMAAYLGHFAENDPYEPPGNVAWLEDALKSASRPVTFYRYPGVGHWFFEPDRPAAYDAAAARLAWERTLAFLQANLTDGA